MNETLTPEQIALIQSTNALQQAKFIRAISERKNGGPDLVRSLTVNNGAGEELSVLEAVENNLDQVFGSVFPNFANRSERLAA